MDDYLDLLTVFHYRPWQQGRGRVEIELTDTGRQTLGRRTRETLSVRYANGPLFFPEEGFEMDREPEDFDVLAYFRSGVEGADDAESQPKIDTPAIVAASHGAGKLVLVSPHPESDVGFDWLLQGAVRAVVAPRPAPAAD